MTLKQLKKMEKSINILQHTNLITVFTTYNVI